MSKLSLKGVWIAVIISAVALIFTATGFQYRMFYDSCTISYESLIDDAKSIKDFTAGDGRIIALSDDPWIEYTNNIKNVKTVTVNVDYLSNDYTDSELFLMWTDGSMERYVVKLHNGSNIIYLHRKIKNIDVIRYDLLRGEGQEIGISNIIINEPSSLSEALMCDNEYAFIRMFYVFIYILPLILAAAVLYAVKKRNIKSALIATVAAVMTIIVSYTAGITLLADNVFTEKTLFFDSFTNWGNNAKDFEINGNSLTALSDDPWVTYFDNRENTVRTITINVASMSVEENNGELYLFFDDNRYETVSYTLVQGENDIVLPRYLSRINNIRFDLTDKRSTEIAVDSIVFNRRDLLAYTLKNEAGNYYARLLAWFVFVAAAYAPLMLGKRALKKSKVSSKDSLMQRFCSFISYCMIFLSCILSFYIGIYTVVLLACASYIAGRYQYNVQIGQKWDIYSFVRLFWAVILYIVIPKEGIATFMLMPEGGQTVSIMLAVLCGYGIYTAQSDNQGCISVMAEAIIVFLMTVSIEMLAKIYFKGFDIPTAATAVLASKSIWLNAVLFGAVYYTIRNLFGRIMGRGAGIILWLFLFAGNLVKLKYHDSSFMPMDILQIGDFISVVEMYIPETAIIGGSVLLAAMIVWIIYKKRRTIAKYKPNLYAAVFSLVIMIFLSSEIQSNTFIDIGVDVTGNWRGTRSCVEKGGIMSYSYIKFKEIFEIFPKAGENYTKSYMQELKAQLDAEHIDNTSNIKPDVIFIMEESMFDVEKVPDVEFSQQVDSNMLKYKKSIAISPKYGGGTGSVEFEGLTGMSNYFFLENVVPYVTYWNNEGKTIPGLASEFKGNGYETIAIHPNYGEVYNRTTVYNCMGFDKFIDKAEMDFSGENLTDDGYFKDDVLADVIEDTIESAKEPAFVFAVTIENHTLYENKYKETEVKLSSDRLSDSELHNLEQYSQGVLNADRFIGKMIDYVDNAERPTILYIWGDHLPAMSAFGTLGYIEDKYNKYSTPIIAYSNYKDIEIEQEYITPNQLAPQILRDAQINYSSYFDYIYSLREKYPVIHKEFGIPSDDEDIKKYELIQYDILFGKRYLLGYD